MVYIPQLEVSTDLNPKRFSELLTAYRTTGDLAARKLLIEHNLPLVETLARRYAHRGEQLEDLVQVGCVGLMGAIDRFDVERGNDLTAFAVPSIVGEIKRHLRDRTFPVRPPRRLHELSSALPGLREQLTVRLDRVPTVEELAGAAAATPREVVDALDLERTRRPLSLSQPGLGAAEPSLPQDAYDASEARLLLDGGLRALDERERRIVRLRFFGGLSQAEIAGEVGISPIHVSRLLRQALDKLRRELDAA
jgi:RNA polymerase sigma-B factor